MRDDSENLTDDHEVCQLSAIEVPFPSRIPPLHHFLGLSRRWRGVEPPGACAPGSVQIAKRGPEAMLRVARFCTGRAASSGLRGCILDAYPGLAPRAARSRSSMAEHV